MNRATSALPASASTPEAEIDVDEALVRRLLEAQHPDLAALPIRAFEHGWDNVMFRLGDALLVRMPRREAAATLIEHESRTLPMLEPALPLPMPVPIRHGEPGEGYPWSWNVLPWIEGEPADVRPIPASEADAFASFLLALHRPAPADAPENAFRGVPLGDRRDALEERFERLRAETDVMTPGIEGLWREGLEAPDGTRTVWLHGDLHPRNVLVRDAQIAGIIDWGDVTSGDPASDLAGIWLLFDDPAARATLIERAIADEALLARSLGWAVGFAAIFLDTGLRGDDRMAAIGRRTFARLEADAR